FDRGVSASGFSWLGSAREPTIQSIRAPVRATVRGGTMVPQTLNTPWQREVAARVVVIGGSSGGVLAVRHLLASMNVAVPVVVAIHVPSSDGSSDVMQKGISG